MILPAYLYSTTYSATTAPLRPEDYGYVTGGVLRYIMLTGQVPFDDGRAKQIVAQQVSGDIVLLRPMYGKTACTAHARTRRTKAGKHRCHQTIKMDDDDDLRRRVCHMS